MACASTWEAMRLLRNRSRSRCPRASVVRSRIGVRLDSFGAIVSEERRYAESSF